MRYIASLSLFALLLLMSPAMAGTGTVFLWTNGSINFSNLDSFAVNVITYNQNTKVFWVNVSNASDTITFQLYNFTSSQIQDLKWNGTAQNVYASNSTGQTVFTTTQATGNISYRVAPALSQGGYNSTWGWFRTTLNFINWYFNASNKIQTNRTITGNAVQTRDNGDLIISNTSITFANAIVFHESTGTATKTVNFSNHFTTQKLITFEAKKITNTAGLITTFATDENDPNCDTVGTAAGSTRIAYNNGAVNETAIVSMVTNNTGKICMYSNTNVNYLIILRSYEQ